MELQWTDDITKQGQSLQNYVQIYGVYSGMWGYGSGNHRQSNGRNFLTE